MFSYIDQERLEINLSRSYPVIQVLEDGTEKLWDNVIEAMNSLGGKPGGVHKVLRGERKMYLGYVWKKSAAVLKPRELLESPTG